MCRTDGVTVADGLTDGWGCHTDDGTVADGLTDWLVCRADGDVGQPDRRGRMVYRRSDGDGRSDGRCTRLTGWVADGRVMDRVTGGWTDGSYDGRAGMTDGLSV